MSLTKESKEYYESTDRKHRNAKGQFFTEDKVKELALKDISIPDKARVLENSCGSGEFIKAILEINPNIEIDGYDIEQGLVDICNNLYPSANVVLQDFLLMDHKPIYDFAIGNPPYFEMKKKDSEELHKKYKSVLSGRANIYSMFFKASIDSLKHGGKLIYVVPTSMNNGSYFKNLRKFIIENCNIDDIVLLGDSGFEGVQQNTMIIKLTKLHDDETNNGKFVFTTGKISVFSTKCDRLRELSSKGQTLEQLKFNVYTGNLVWNQQKQFMSNDPTHLPLLWASNIGDGCLVYPNPSLTKHKEKGQYVSKYNTRLKVSKFELSLKPYLPTPKKGVMLNIEPMTERSIVLNRVTGAGSNAKIRAAIVDIPTGYYTENHVNYIVKGKDCEYTLEELLESLRSDNTIEFIRMLTGNTQISKTELQKIIPFCLTKESE